MSSPTSQTYQELQQAYSFFNQHLFGASLPDCLITLQREKQTYGYFSAGRFVSREGGQKVDEIAINPSYFAVVPILEVLQTLVHEMVHLWQHHFGDPGRRGYHNQQWADKMEEVGLIPSHTGQPGGRRTGEKMADYPDPDGAFVKVAHQLLEKDFVLRWLDRFPPAPPSPQGLRSPRALPTGAAEEALPEWGEREHVLPEEIQVPAGPQNRSNRLKQRCPSCGAQAWGKPSLKLICGELECGGAAFEIAGEEH